MMKSTPFSSLPKYMDPFISKRYHLHSETHTVTPKEHWVFFAEILDVSFLIRPRVKVHLGNNKTATIHFEPELIHEVPKTFEWDDLEPGNTIAILYAQRKLMGDGEWGVKQEYLDTVFVVSAGVEMVSRYARQIFDTNRTCFHPKCGKTKGLMTCRELQRGHVLQRLPPERFRTRSSLQKFRKHPKSGGDLQWFGW
ncbi:hypothetical protein BDR26DRAFT_614728 [Obelidium mucronatum]|nr:hypothetical protein BDR26DRAFT_614728 [Obelidium mucronatum]